VITLKAFTAHVRTMAPGSIDVLLGPGLDAAAGHLSHLRGDPVVKVVATVARYASRLTPAHVAYLASVGLTSELSRNPNIASDDNLAAAFLTGAERAPQSWAYEHACQTLLRAGRPPWGHPAWSSLLAEFANGDADQRYDKLRIMLRHPGITARDLDSLLLLVTDFVPSICLLASYPANDSASALAILRAAGESCAGVFGCFAGGALSAVSTEEAYPLCASAYRHWLRWNRQEVEELLVLVAGAPPSEINEWWQRLATQAVAATPEAYKRLRSDARAALGSSALALALEHHSPSVRVAAERALRTPAAVEPWTYPSEFLAAFEDWARPTSA
jgi:hypothetical protein